VKNFLPILFLLFTCSIAQAQCQFPIVSDSILLLPDNPARFIQGEDSMQRFILNRAKTKKISFQEDVNNDLFRIRFVVNIDGNLSDFKLFRCTQNEFTNELISILKQMPAWCSAENKGKKVRSYFILPIYISK
jgi:hypothetical protein